MDNEGLAVGDIEGVKVGDVVVEIIEFEGIFKSIFPKTFVVIVQEPRSITFLPWVIVSCAKYQEGVASTK